MKLKNSRHEKFALALFKGMSQHDAALEAGYSPNYIDQAASRLYRNVKIFDRVLELHEMAASDAVMPVQERKERLSEIARARLSDFMEAGPDGAWVNIGVDGCQSAALQELISRTEYDDDGAHPAVITRIKLHNPIPAIDLLNKMDKVYSDMVPVHNETRILNIIVVDSETRDLISQVKQRTGKLIEPDEND